MELWQAVVLGFVQGLTEFLPVSSSGHLAFFERCFGMEDITLFFPIVLHLGTLVAVCAVFWKDIINLFKKPFKTLGYLIVATIPAAIAGLFLEDPIENLVNGEYFGIIIAVFFVVTAVLLFTTEFVAKKLKNRERDMGWRTVLPMAFAQAFAVLPGVSRSGSTICAGTLAGGKSEKIAKFSFLMSVPVILGGFVVSLGKGIIKGELQAEFSANGSEYVWCVFFGFIVSAVSGLFAIKVMLKAIQKTNYKWFSLYLVLLAIVCITLHFTYFNA